MEDWNAWLEKVLAPPTTSIQNAAKVLGYGKGAGYEAVKRGDIPTIDIGQVRKTVPTAWLRGKIGR